jgi:hypothetical protein
VIRPETEESASPCHPRHGPRDIDGGKIAADQRRLETDADASSAHFGSAPTGARGVSDQTARPHIAHDARSRALAALHALQHTGSDAGRWMLRARRVWSRSSEGCALVSFGSLLALLLSGCSSDGSGDGPVGSAGAGGTGSAGSTAAGGSAGTDGLPPSDHPPYTGAVDSYFLSECLASCGQGLACVAGLCSQSCSAGDASCTAFAEGAVCLEQVGPDDGSVSACDVPCGAERDCRGASYCDLSIMRCRAPELTGGGVDTLELVSGARVLIEDEYLPRDLIVDDQYLYWTNGSAAIRRAPLAGGAAETLTIAHSLGSILAAGEYVYFSDYLAADNTGTVSRILRTGGEPSVLATGVVPGSLALDGERVYWADQGQAVGDGRIYSMALDGSDSLLLAEGLNAPFGLTVGAGFLYFANAVESCPVGNPTCVAGVTRVPLAGGATAQVDANGSASNVIATDGGVYWLRDSTPQAVMFAPHGAGPEVVLSIPSEGAGELTRDGGALYWASSDKVLRLPFASPAVERLLADRHLSRSAALSADSVFVAESEAGRILAVAKDGSGNRPKAPIEGPCPSVVGDTGEMALSPRADENLEALALSLEPRRVIASQAAYERVVADMAALRALAPELASIQFTPPYERSVEIVFGDVATQSIARAEYSAWNCLNDFYGPMEVSDVETATTPGLVRLQFQRRFNGELLAELYRQLPGVTAGEPRYSEGLGTALAARRSGDTFDYFVRTSDVSCDATCPSPIDDATARHFQSTAAGSVSEQ